MVHLLDVPGDNARDEVDPRGQQTRYNQDDDAHNGYGSSRFDPSNSENTSARLKEFYE